MPIIQSAKKRVRSAKKAAVRNLKTKREYKAAVKTFQAKLAGGSKSLSEELSAAQSKLDIAVKKKVISKNKAARKKAQLAKLAKQAGAKLVQKAPKPKSSSKPGKRAKAKK